MSAGQTMTERFWAKVNKASDSECWEWRAYRNVKGYGRFNIGGNVIRNAHRVAYELAHGPIADGMQLDHLCRNRACVNPAHLEPVTPAENSRRGNSGQHMKALNGSKTHCPAGHPYSGANLYVGPSGGRRCRQCTNALWRKNQHKYKAARRAKAGVA